MLVPVESLIDGVVHTLMHDVLPSVESRFSRGQLYAAVDVLQNLRDRVERKAEDCAAEADSIAGALERIRAALTESGYAEGAGRVAAAAESVPPAPPQERAAALRAAFVAALAEVEQVPEDAAPDARAAVAAHLSVQAMRDVATLKPSMLNEISKG